MDNVGERIPIGDVLGILRTVHHAMPEFHIAAFANENAAVEVFNEGRDGCGKAKNYDEKL